jgi:hypothetical protein
VPGFQVADRLENLIQVVAAVDDRRELAGLDESAESGVRSSAFGLRTNMLKGDWKQQTAVGLVRSRWEGYFSGSGS